MPTPVVPASADERMRIAQTGGLGVALRNTPRLDAREPRGLLEGALVTVLERQGTDWARVCGDGGQEGGCPRNACCLRSKCDLGDSAFPKEIRCFASDPPGRLCPSLVAAQPVIKLDNRLSHAMTLVHDTVAPLCPH